MCRRRVAQTGQVDVHDDEATEQDEQQHVHRVHHAHAAKHLHHGRKAPDIPQQQSGKELQRHQQHHDDLVHHALQGVELAVGARMMRIGVTLEDAVAIELHLPEAGAKIFHRAEFGVVDLDLVSEKVEAQPQEEIRDQHEADPVVSDHRGSE